RHIRKLVARAPAPLDRLRAALPQQPGGVFVVTGGAGKLGLLLADLLVREHGLDVALIGRSQPGAARAAAIAAIRSRTARASYHPADIGEAGELERALSAIRRT